MARTFNKQRRTELGPEIEAACGRFIIEWAMLEQQLDFAIHELTGMDHDLSSVVTANAGTKGKLDMIMALAHCMKDVLGETVTPEYAAVAGATSNASGLLRNFLIHGQPFYIAFEDETVGVWAKFAARKSGVAGSAVRLSAKYLDDQTKSVTDLINRWETVRSRGFKELRLWDDMPADLREDSRD